MKYCFHCGKLMFKEHTECRHCGRFCDNYILEYKNYGNEYCTECGTEIHLLVGETHCSECGNESHRTKQERFLQEMDNNPREPIFESTPGKCRHCQTPLGQGTLCNKCLKTLNDNELTIQERKKRNSNEKINSFILLGMSIVFAVIGCIRFASGDSSFLLFVIAVASFYFFYKIRRKNLCEQCGSVNSMVNVSFDLVGLEKPNELDCSENVSQNQCRYKHTYQCKECGHKKFKYSNSILG